MQGTYACVNAFLCVDACVWSVGADAYAQRPEKDTYAHVLKSESSKVLEAVH